MLHLKIYKIANGVFRHVIDDNPNTTFYNSAANNIIVKDNHIHASKYRYILSEVSLYDGNTLIPNTTMDQFVISLHSMGYNIADTRSSSQSSSTPIGFSTEAKQLPNNHQVTVSNIATLATAAKQLPNNHQVTVSNIATLATAAKQLPNNHQVTVSNIATLATHAKQDTTNQKLDSIIANTTPDTAWDTITPTFNATSDVYAYSLAGTVNKVITINYTNASKEIIQNIVKS
jgi:hypothetical protein